ncbi:MAG TPA: ribose-5-phosphate isomerase RpiA [Tepidisphaeraceae bacterium]|nr:ribose-5-phosphate isomerase RpiA [Tepidisphaeraceae bacterium]
MTAKELAGITAVSYVRSGMVVGLGTGSTAKYFIDALGAAIRDGKLKDIRGIPTSVHSAQQAASVGIPLTSFAEFPTVDLTVDGADEVGPGLNLIKGRGGALLREKIVAQNSRRLVIIADQSKKVAVLGSHLPLPVEVAQFSHEAAAHFLTSLGCKARLRQADAGGPFVTDNGNFIYDCTFARITDPAGVEETLCHRAGIVETGLFISMADTALIATDDAVETLTRDWQGLK